MRVRTLLGMQTVIAHWIDGKQAPSESGRTSPVFNPATGEQTASVGLASTAEVDAAVAVAKEADREWRTA